jgi:hypothetical protein
VSLPVGLCLCTLLGEGDRTRTCDGDGRLGGECDGAQTDVVSARAGVRAVSVSTEDAWRRRREVRRMDRLERMVPVVSPEKSRPPISGRVEKNRRGRCDRRCIYPRKVRWSKARGSGVSTR